MIVGDYSLEPGESRQVCLPVGCVIPPGMLRGEVSADEIERSVEADRDRRRDIEDELSRRYEQSSARPAESSPADELREAYSDCSADPLEWVSIPTYRQAARTDAAEQAVHVRLATPCSLDELGELLDRAPLPSNWRGSDPRGDASAWLLERRILLEILDTGWRVRQGTESREQRQRFFRYWAWQAAAPAFAPAPRPLTFAQETAVLEGCGNVADLRAHTRREWAQAFRQPDRNRYRITRGIIAAASIDLEAWPTRDGSPMPLDERRAAFARDCLCGPAPDRTMVNSGLEAHRLGRAMLAAIGAGPWADYPLGALPRDWRRSSQPVAVA